MAKDKNHNLVKRGEVWYFRLRKGKQVIRKTLSTSVTEARRLRGDLLREMALYGDIRTPQEVQNENPLFGELAEEWYRIRSKQIKASTMRDYRSSMNLHILPKFGNRPIKEITYLEIEYRPMMQTRHTFATISLSEGENIGWVQHMLGHSSLQMIFTKYYAWMPKETRNDGSAFMKAYYSIDLDHEAGEK
jgi:hypothetical protein